MCYECFKKFEPFEKELKIDGRKVEILYVYNDFFKENLFKLKGCDDIELASIFLEYRLRILQFKYMNYFIVPAPSSVEDDERRGFNHVVEIFKRLNRPILQIIRKKISFKQSDFDKENREQIIDKLEVINGDQIKRKNVLIVDDIITTGSTIRSIIKLLSKYKPKSIRILVLAHPNFEEQVSLKQGIKLRDKFRQLFQSKRQRNNNKID